MVSELLSNGVVANGHYDVDPASNLLQNDAYKPFLVQKFGGTSVGKVPDVISDIVVRHLKNHRVAVVCSARSIKDKFEGTTSRLVRAAEAAEKFQPAQYEAIVETVRQDHLGAAQKFVKNKDILQTLLLDIEEECQEIVTILHAAVRVEEVTPRTLDTIVSRGENLSCRLITAMLRDQGVDAQFVDLSHAVHLDAKHGLDQECYEKIARVISKEVLKCGNKVPVVTGYFGVIPGGLLNHVGRGYTDLCAALIAVGCVAEELQIWKEVDGVFTANPVFVPTAVLLPTITPEEAAELTYYGSEVIHPFTMEQVIRAKIPIRIRNVMNLRNEGTLIQPNPISAVPSCASMNGKPSGLFRNRSSISMMEPFRPKRPTAITIKPNILVINVHSNKRSLSHGFFANIFSILDKWRLSVDLISTSEVHISMALHSKSVLVRGNGDAEKEIVNADLAGAVEELGQYGTVDISDEMAILSLVGRQMKNLKGISGKMFSVLGDNNVNIEMISQGASEINISCVIEERDAERAMNVLHTNLFTFLE